MFKKLGPIPTFVTLLLVSGTTAFATPPVAEDAPDAHTKLSVVQRVAPVYPPAARGQQYGTQRCIAHVWLDATGTPEQIKVKECLRLFHPAAKDAVKAWEWSPPTVNGESVATKAVVKIEFSDECSSQGGFCRTNVLTGNLPDGSGSLSSVSSTEQVPAPRNASPQ